jgi:hypothetical protein
VGADALGIGLSQCFSWPNACKSHSLFFILFVQIFHLTLPYLVQAAQGFHTLEARVFQMTEALQKKNIEHEKSMAEVLESVASNYKSLEEEHFKNLNAMKEAEERERIETEKQAQMEEQMAQMEEKMKKLESECILSISMAREEGKEEVMGEIKAQFQKVYNTEFRDGWKSALSKSGVPKGSELYLRDNTSIPYPVTRLKDSDSEDEGEGEEEDGEEAQGEQDNRSPTMSVEPTVVAASGSNI